MFQESTYCNDEGIVLFRGLRGDTEMPGRETLEVRSVTNEHSVIAGQEVFKVGSIMVWQTAKHEIGLRRPHFNAYFQ